jgi:FkbM family methyltransferase
MARQAVSYEKERMAARTNVAQRSKLAKRDGDLALFETPWGVSWISGAQPLQAAQFRAADLYHWPPRWAENPDRPLVKRGGIMIDAGGHIGESAATALKMGAARVISIEVDPVNAEAIRRNLAAAIADGRETVLQVGVWDSPGTLQLERGEASTMSETHVTAHGQNSLTVPVTTIDQIVEELGLSRVDAIKLVIEGAEPNALRGARKTLARFKPALAVGTYHNPGDLTEIRQIVQSTRPDYTERATRCLPAHSRVQPHVLFFE